MTAESIHARPWLVRLLWTLCISTAEQKYHETPTNNHGADVTSDGSLLLV